MAILDQITFDLEDDHQPKEFLSGRPIEQPVPKPKSTRGRKSIKEGAAEMGLVSVPPDEELFKKQYYGIGEVAQMFSVNTSQLRYWENEFDILQPRKNRKGDRFFTPADIKNLQLIHDLLRRRKFTIQGAKDYLKKEAQASERWVLIESLQRLKTFLQEIKAGL